MKSSASITKFSGGLSDSQKEGQEAAFKWGRSLDFRSDAKQTSILPKTTKVSGSIVTDLPMGSDRVGTDTYVIGDTGKIYKENSSGTWTQEHLAGDSVGNGISYFGEDGGLYFGQNTTFGRYINGEWYDNFLGAEGGSPTNTYSLDLESGSSQYASRADTASLSITGDLSLEAFAKHESLPTSGNSMVLISKWDEQTNKRSYKMDITGVSNFFGDGSDGALTIAADTTEAPIDSTAVGTAGTKTLTATNVSFAAGQKILIIQMIGTNAGVSQRTTIESYTAGTITTADNLAIDFSCTSPAKAQVRVMKQYTNVTVNSGKIYAPKRWSNSTGVGGILAFYANGTVTITGTINASAYDLSTSNNLNLAYGFEGGKATCGIAGIGFEGEGTGGDNDSQSLAANGSGGGGGTGEYSSAPYGAAGGGGGANITAGTNGGISRHGAAGGTGGTISGTIDLSTFTLGGGAGQGGAGTDSAGTNYGGGGGGGGGIMIFGATVTITGSINANGRNGEGGAASSGGGGGGAGGSVLIKAQTATLGTALITATGGVGGGGDGGTGGTGGNGGIHLDYSSSYTGTTSPTLDVAQDSSLSTTNGWALRLLVSSTGTNSETYSKNIDISTDIWARWGVTWDASASTATFYKNGVNIGTAVGALTAINDNASKFSVGCDFASDGTARNFYDGLIDDVRVWNDVRTDTEMKNHNEYILYGTEANNISYWKFDNAATDTNANANTLTLTGSPVYSVDVPFSGVTTRADRDQYDASTGDTYTLTTAINEGATHIQQFAPAKDPQKSIEVSIGAVGTGDWTMTIHDALNRVVGTSTVANAQLHTSYYEFPFTVWRPVVGATYHYHLTSTVDNGTVVSGTNNDLDDSYFNSYYQFLVSDQYHPMIQMLNFLAIGNERYVAKWEGLTSATYAPHKITLPSGYRVRCFAYWREYLAIGTWKGTSITDEDKGRIFFWDGTADTYNYSIDVPEGGVNAMFGTKGYLYVWPGYSGDLLLYQGGDEAKKIKQLPLLTKDKYVEILPGAATMWRSLIHFGVAGNSDSTAIHKGIYTWGSLNQNYPASLGFDYPLSLGDSTSTSVKIGMVAASGQALYIGWENQNVYGVDKISVSNAPYASASYESLITDLSELPKLKEPLVVRVDFEPLVSGQSIRSKFKVDRGDWTLGETEDTVGATNTRLRVGQEAKEIEFGYDMFTTTTSPVVTGVTLESEKGNTISA